MELSKFLDESLNFLKRCRHRDDKENILFTEVKTSVEKSFHRTITIENFRQLLSVVPDFYSHSWEKGNRVRQAQLAINFESDCPKVKTFDYFNNRQDVLKQRMTDLCISDYRKAMKSMPVRLLTEEESDLIANPLKYQMWHHSFDPHTQVSKIEEAYL